MGKRSSPITHHSSLITHHPSLITRLGTKKRHNLRDDARYLFFGETVVERQPQQTPRHVVGDCHRPGGPVELHAGGRRMQRHIMKCGVDAARFEVPDQPRARREVVEQDVEHVTVAGRAGRIRLRQAQQAGALEFLKPASIRRAQALTLGGDRIGVLELSVQKGPDQLARQKRGANVDPGVLVDLAAKELRAVAAFLADDLGARDELGVVDEQRPALAANYVFRLVELETAKMPNRARPPAPVVG